MNNKQKKQLEIFATKIRLAALEGIFTASSGHPGGSLSIADALSYLYNVEMKIDPSNPKWEDRDRFVLSKGHCAPALYGALALRGFFDINEVKNLRKLGHFLQGHPDLKGTPGVICQQALSDREYPPHAVWHCQQSCRARTTVYIR